MEGEGERLIVGIHRGGGDCGVGGEQDVGLVRTRNEDQLDAWGDYSMVGSEEDGVVGVGVGNRRYEFDDDLAVNLGVPKGDERGLLEGLCLDLLSGIVRLEFFSSQGREGFFGRWGWLTCKR